MFISLTKQEAGKLWTRALFQSQTKTAESLGNKSKCFAVKKVIRAFPLSCRSLFSLMRWHEIHSRWLIFQIVIKLIFTANAFALHINGVHFRLDSLNSCSLLENNSKFIVKKCHEYKVKLSQDFNDSRWQNLLEMENEDDAMATTGRRIFSPSHVFAPFTTEVSLFSRDGGGGGKTSQVLKE